MIDQAFLDALEAQGVPPETIYKAIRSYNLEKQEALREAARQRQIKCRSQKRESENSGRVTPVTVTSVTSVTSPDDQAHISRENITTRAPALIPVGLSNDNPPIDKKTNKKVSPPDGGLSPNSEFLDWAWKTIPKRKTDSRQTFVQAVEKAARTTAIEVIKAGIVSYAAYFASLPERDKQFVDGAAKWINQAKWENDWMPSAPAKKKWLC